MNISTTICPCCSTPMLHHFGDRREYWFCRHCWQEMPELKHSEFKKHQKSFKIVSLSTKFKVSRKSLPAYS